MFVSTEDFLASNDVESGVIKPITTSHFINLVKNFPKYFLLELDNAKLGWIQNPFIMSNQSIDCFPLNSQKKVAELFCDLKLQLEFSEKKLCSFRLSLKAEYPASLI